MSSRSSLEGSQRDTEVAGEPVTRFPIIPGGIATRSRSAAGGEGGVPDHPWRDRNCLATIAQRSTLSTSSRSSLEGSQQHVARRAVGVAAGSRSSLEGSQRAVIRPHRTAYGRSRSSLEGSQRGPGLVPRAELVPDHPWRDRNTNPGAVWMVCHPRSRSSLEGSQPQHPFELPLLGGFPIIPGGIATLVG